MQNTLPVGFLSLILREFSFGKINHAVLHCRALENCPLFGHWKISMGLSLKVKRFGRFRRDAMMHWVFKFELQRGFFPKQLIILRCTFSALQNFDPNLGSQNLLQSQFEG